MQYRFDVPEPLVTLKPAKADYGNHVWKFDKRHRALLMATWKWTEEKGKEPGWWPKRDAAHKYANSHQEACPYGFRVMQCTGADCGMGYHGDTWEGQEERENA